MESDTILENEEKIKAREYQIQLEEIASQRNTIIYLPTGSGKTYIAIRLIARFKKSLQKPWGQGGKRTFFLVNTVSLVKQQQKQIKDLCPVKCVGAYSSEDGVDYWDKVKWDNELQKYQVVVMTGQILCDMLTHSYIRMSDINFIIFDECHNAVDDHPMRLIMKHYAFGTESERPLILGLTATLLNANVKVEKIEEKLKELESTFQATIATVDDLGPVLMYSTNAFEVVQYYSAIALTSAATEAISLLRTLQVLANKFVLPQLVQSSELELQRGQKQILIKDSKVTKMVKNMITSMIKHIIEMGVYGGALTILAYIIVLERLKRRVITTEEEVFYKVIITHCTEARMVLLESMKNETAYEKIIKHSSEQILQLLNVLKEYNPDVVHASKVPLKVNRSKKPLSGIIFVQQRFTAKILYNILKEVKESNPREFEFLKHDFMVGFNVNPYNNTREEYFHKKSSEQVLLKFRNSDLNCIISTCVIEEGVDIPQCRLVIRYDPILEYRSYIQSKGRCRSLDGSYVMLVDNEKKMKFQESYRVYQRIEQIILKILVGNTEDRVSPEEENLYELEIPPYVTENGGQLFAVSATSLLYRYCQTLPHDAFTLIVPTWIQEDVGFPKVQKKVSIIMPISCPIKEPIMGLPMADMKTAKRSAALNACIKLHEYGALDPETLLPKRYANVDFEDADVKSCFPNWPWNKDDDPEHVPKAGTKKRMRKHNKVYPECLKGAGHVNTTTTLVLHLIKLKANFEKPKESRERALYDLIQRNEGFGFLTFNPLPTICDFPMFLTVGEVSISIESNYAVINIDSETFEVVKRFHLMVFDQALEVLKQFLVFDGTENCLYVVPINRISDPSGFNIDWDVIAEYREIPEIYIPTSEERRHLRVNKDDYVYAVVTPWYRASLLPDRYVVSNVLEYMTPQSHFDTQSYGSFAEYYVQKYNLEIMGQQDQPLLEVRNISTRMNCLMPRAATINSFTDKQQKLISAAQGDDKPKGFTEIFIPEFCIKYEFPGVLWYKAMMLPSIIHRVSMLLVANDLRVEIAKHTKIGRPTLLRGEKWEPLQVNMPVAVKSLLSQVEEPTVVNSIDRINNPIDESAPRPLNIISMKETVYQLQKKKINKEYLWDEEIEPTDIERNLSTTTLMDIECYDAFVTSPYYEEKSVRSPQHLRPTAASTAPLLAAAILPPPIKYNSKIALLSCKETSRGPELRDILAAITTIKSHDTHNLERVETLGDSFLKFAASLYLYQKFPDMNEGKLTYIKSRLIGNKNLYYAGERVSLGGRMKVEQFSPRKDFMVPGFFAPKELAKFIKEKKIRPSFLIGMSFPKSEVLSGKISAASWKKVQQRYTEQEGAAEPEPQGMAQNAMQCYVRAQAVSDKSIADCVEALIGTYLVHGGIPSAIKILEWFRIIPAQDKLNHLLVKTVPSPIKDGKVTEEQINLLLYHNREDVEAILDYKFKDPSYLLEALSHPSYTRNRFTNSYERFEFIGDAILDFLITSYIYENWPDLKPGELTDLRSALVNNVSFAAFVVKLGLHKFICYPVNPALANAIKNFVEHQEQRDHEIVEDVLYLIDEVECQIAEYIEVPKVLSDIFEALMGAIYIDSGGDLKTIWNIVYRIMHKEIHNFATCIPKQPTRVLYEQIHACPVFGVSKQVSEDIPKMMISLTFTKNGIQHTIYGVGQNKSQAKVAAAKLALKILSI